MKTFLLTFLFACSCVLAGPPEAETPDHARIKQIGQIAGSALRDTVELKKLLKESVAINESQGKELVKVKDQITELSAVLVETQKDNKKLKDANSKEFFRGLFGGVVGSLIIVGLIFARRQKALPVPEPKPSPEPDRSIPSNARPPRRSARRSSPTNK